MDKAAYFCVGVCVGPGTPLECIKGHMRVPIFSGKWVFLAVVSGRCPRKPGNGGGGGVFVIANGNQYPR